MKRITTRAAIDLEKCVGCGTCLHVCPVIALRPNPVRPLARTKTPPCAEACPAGNDTEGVTRLVQDCSFADAAALLVETNPFPAVTGRVCFHPCEDGCSRKGVDGAVSIPQIERLLADYVPEPAPPAERKGETVAVVGSGPAGLSCAYYLLSSGYEVTVFESRPQLGGWLRYGIPEYRLPNDVLDGEIDRLSALGMRALTDTAVGRDVPFEELDAFSAVFVAAGRHRAVRLRVPGEDALNVMSGAEFLTRVNSGELPSLGEHVVVIGGGNSAIDAARVALRCGSRATLVYRRSRAEMPAFAHEVEQMEAEGVPIEFLASPVRFVVNGQGATAVECLRMELQGVGDDGRLCPVPVDNSNFQIAADSFIVAVGEKPELSGIATELLEEGRIRTDAFGRTGRPKVFAGGDVADYAGSVPAAIGAGRTAARAIDDVLSGRPLVEPVKLPTVGVADMNLDYVTFQETCAVGRLSTDAASRSFCEIQSGIDAAAATGEAKRCLGCASLPMIIDDDCRGCGNCEERCPTRAIAMNPLETPFTVRVEVLAADAGRIAGLCHKAHLNPESIVCFCTTTRAEEIAAAILQGAETPEQISLSTGARTGCSVLCIQPIFRLLQAAQVDYETPTMSDVWYKTIPLIWDLPAETREQFDAKGFRFSEDLAFLDKLAR
jgi:NADPH-dependent glutamate synthase beta subunit-like oxidoreductase/bacterioferritin-associated ferredoxin